MENKFSPSMGSSPSAGINQVQIIMEQVNEIESEAHEIYYEAYHYWKSKGYPKEDAHEIAAMELERYLNLMEGTI